jgi:hypothetical protein
MINLLVISCDKYRHLWTPYFLLLDKYSSFNWDKKYLLSESHEHISSDVIPLKSNLKPIASNWSNNLLYALNEIKEEYIMISLDDFFFSELISNENLEKHIHFIKTNPDVGCIRLVEGPAGDQEYSESYTEHSIEQGFRISTQLSIWNTQFLKSVLVKNEDPWSFELNASKRSKNEKYKVLVAKKEFTVQYFNAVIQGKIMKKAVILLKANDYNIPFDKQNLASKVEGFYWTTTFKVIRHVIDFINHRIVKIK